MLEHLRENLGSPRRNLLVTPKVFLMNPSNFELIGWVEVLGMPVLPDESVGHKRVKLVCGVGRAGILDQQPVFWAPDGSPWVIEQVGWTAYTARRTV